ncbi:hypothetical protein, variant 1 [Aphanomyces astaci]|uniref:ubiquitinyl hydrolase 1 n=1 Tax=Aphanomyces astaci TaxID=112090 RepID=W4FDX8_APHAT|nr:hypothetical protein, variant 1 [Aphanomyces astaci]ETV64943.1 hypothetical protein, variant 1 [Aphanomyces astaci]|eukprot:XP_009845568.1 hypothetical protein, variant 1 [Aphanomyces astaci]
MVLGPSDRGDAAVRCDPISRHEPYLGRAIASRFHASCDNFDPCTVSCDHCRVLMFNKAKNNDLPIAVGTPVHIFDTTTWREAHVTCTRIDHLRVLPADSPTDMWVPFTPQFVAPSEKQHARRILLSNSCFDQYVHALHRMNLRLHAVEGDGNCLFRAVSHQLYGDDQHHGIVRRFCMDYMELQRHFFEPFIVGDASAFDRYVRHKRLDAVWGDDPELQALCELYDRPAQVFAYDAAAGAKQLRVFHDTVTRPPICLSFYGGGHYDSVVGPSHASNFVRDVPGAFEARKVAMIQQKQWSSEEATVLELSRKEFGKSALSLDAALCASVECYEAEVARSVDVAEVLTVQAESELHHLQNEMLRSAAQQSEDDLLQAALDASMDPYQHEFEAALALSADGLHQGMYMEGALDEEDEAMQQAIQMSMMQ